MRQQYLLGGIVYNKFTNRTPHKVENGERTQTEQLASSPEQHWGAGCLLSVATPSFEVPHVLLGSQVNYTQPTPVAPVASFLLVLCVSSPVHYVSQPVSYHIPQR